MFVRIFDGFIDPTNVVAVTRKRTKPQHLNIYIYILLRKPNIRFRGRDLRLSHVPFDVCRFEIVEGTRLLARREQYLLLSNVPARMCSPFYIVFVYGISVRNVITPKFINIIVFFFFSAFQNVQVDQKTHSIPAPRPGIRMRILQQFVQQPFQSQFALAQVRHNRSRRKRKQT